MTLLAPDTQTIKHPGKRLKIAAAGLSGLALLVLQACSTAPTPQYPIYMQDKPAEATETAAQAGDGEASSSVMASQAPVAAPQGKVSVSDLPPPPPPPAPPMASSAAAAGQVRDMRAAYVYVLVAHDTLYGVSRRFGVPVKELYDLNGLSPDANLRIGEKVLLPPSAKDNGVDAHANGPGMEKLAVALAAKTPVTPAPKPAPEKASPPPVSKPVVSAPSQTVTSSSASSSSAPAVPATPAGFPSNARLSEMGRGLFVWPVRGKLLVPFGQLAPNVRNDGINIGAASGTEVKAASDGVVVYEGDQVKELGNTIYIKHDNGWYTGYSHLDSMRVKNNERVSKGQVIGTVGQTGVIDKPQLHFEVRYTPSTDIARPIDPTLVLPK
jgi:murein DD-endopeptidase MepM/ murein hydrolase activator NlpD